LRAVAKAEGFEPTDDDMDAEIARLAAAYNMKSADAKRNLERADQMPAVRSDWKKSRALDWLLEHVEIVDEEGQPVDRSLLEPSSPDADTETQDATEDTEVSEQAAGAPAAQAEPEVDVPQDEETGAQ